MGNVPGVNVRSFLWSFSNPLSFWLIFMKQFKHNDCPGISAVSCTWCANCNITVPKTSFTHQVSLIMITFVNPQMSVGITTNFPVIQTHSEWQGFLNLSHSTFHNSSCKYFSSKRPAELVYVMEHHSSQSSNNEDSHLLGCYATSAINYLSGNMAEHFRRLESWIYYSVADIFCFNSPTYETAMYFFTCNY
jgi:hypothetical protein